MSSLSSSVCPAEGAKWLVHPIRQWIQSPIKLLQPFIKPGMIAVDIGCGPGYFAVGLAELVGSSGKVIGVDLQPEMLAFAQQYATKCGVSDRINWQLCTQTSLELNNVQADFVLAFYVVHEIPDRIGLFKQILKVLKPDGKFLLIEPNFHVSKSAFTQTVADAKSAGLIPVQDYKVFLSRGILLGKPR